MRREKDNQGGRTASRGECGMNCSTISRSRGWIRRGARRNSGTLAARRCVPQRLTFSEQSDRIIQELPPAGHAERPRRGYFLYGDR